ncbi:CBS domain-containing protein [Pedobacter ginsengisoli]|uniref:CBS domain-containing protein n=1 Tax=Pedobacter ginsengisoli TaxID=363852 RepID=UPI00254A2297|nr:CBS domain-containing protein [Pedobacter ginsengisoli]
MIKSVINAKKTFNHFKKAEVKIDSEQMVMSALEVMITTKEFELPVFESGKCIGVVYFKDLVLFLAQGIEDADLFVHKLNYTVESAVLIMMKTKIKEAI